MSDNSKLVIGLVLIAVALIVFPIVLTGANQILTWTEDAASISDFTGLETLVKISPLLIFIGSLAAGGVLTFSGFRGRVASRRSKSRKLR